MNTISFDKDLLHIGEKIIKTPYAILDAFPIQNKVIVLLDPDGYLADPSFTSAMRRKPNSMLNLVAYTEIGQKAWEAELPEDIDYYYEIASRQPLLVYSFSSYKCEIDPASGKIKSRVFFK